MQADGKKIVTPSKQQALSSRLEMELLRPLRVAIVSRGPDLELLVANPVELSGKGRPLVFHDITLALKMLNVGIFSVHSLLAHARSFLIVCARCVNWVLSTGVSAAFSHFVSGVRCPCTNWWHCD